MLVDVREPAGETIINKKKLGIDEITQLKEGKNYAAVLMDLETRKLLTLLKKRNQEVIAE